MGLSPWRREDQMFGKHLLTPFSEWFHVKTDSTYIVLGLALCSTNGPGEHVEESVVYWSKTHQALRYRLASEFLDGRFLALSANGVPIVPEPQPRHTAEGDN